MAEIYFTIAGTNHHHGQDFLEPKMKVKLVKEPDNEYDKEAIKVEMPGIGHIGYVANSPYTVVGESYSAGRLYDKIGDTAKGTVLYVLPKGVLCVLSTEEKPHKKKQQFFDIYILPPFHLYPSCILGIFAFAFYGMMSEKEVKKDKGEVEE